MRVVASRRPPSPDAREGAYDEHDFRVAVLSPARMARPHRHAEVEFNLLFRGAAEYRMAGERIAVPAGRPAVFWGAAPHRLTEVAPGTRFGVGTVPLAWVLGWALPAPFVERLLAGAVMLGPPGDPGVARWAADHASGDPLRVRASAREVEAMFLRLASDADPAPARLASEPDAVERMSAALARRYREVLPAEEVAREAGLSLTYAQRLFRAATGLTIGEALVRHRVVHARRLLAGTDLPMEAVARESGFGSVARFHAVFRARAGVTPGEYRRSLVVRA